MRKAHRGATRRKLGGRVAHACSRAGQALYVVELSLAQLAGRRQGPAARSYLGGARARRPRLPDQNLKRSTRLDAAIGSCAGDGDARYFLSRGSAFWFLFTAVQLSA